MKMSGTFAGTSGWPLATELQESTEGVTTMEGALLMAAEDATYEGWSNYPTWAVNIWLSNDEGLYHETIEKAKFASNQADPTNGLASSLRYWVENELAPDLGASFAADLLGYALGEVDWHEIADSWLEDLED